MSKIKLGTSGWSYKEWVGPFYPNNETKKLSHFTHFFKTAEINSTFYSYPTRGTVLGWIRYTPKDFVFSAKIPKIITHEKKLNVKEGVKFDLNRFEELMEPLKMSEKLSILLIQLPPGLRKDLDLLENFLKVLPEDYRFAIEFRNKTWWDEDTWKLLRKYKIANTIVDETLLPPDPIVTANFAYIRWHGRGDNIWYNYRYSMDELKPWVHKIKELEDISDNIYGYFNNHYHGYAVENCIQVLEMLGLSVPEQIEAKKKLEKYMDLKYDKTKFGNITFQSSLDSSLNNKDIS